MFRELAPLPIPSSNAEPRMFPSVRSGNRWTWPCPNSSPEAAEHCPSSGSTAQPTPHFRTQHCTCPQQHTYLVKIGKTVRVLAQTLVLSPESVTSSYFPELLQVNNIQCTEQRRPFVTTMHHGRMCPHRLPFGR